LVADGTRTTAVIHTVGGKGAAAGDNANVPRLPTNLWHHDHRQRVVGHSDVELDNKKKTFLIGSRKELDPGVWFMWDAKWSRGPLPIKPEDVHDGPDKASIYGFVLGNKPVQGSVAAGKPRGPQILAAKNDLSSIGYSVSAKDGMPQGDQFDEGLLRAIYRFRSHYGPRKLSAGEFNKTKHHLTYELGLLIKKVLADSKP
jgi:N-acetyl-anhydromuramyl-L-alanine amidase AmpD